MGRLLRVGGGHAKRRCLHLEAAVRPKSVAVEELSIVKPKVCTLSQVGAHCRYVQLLLLATCSPRAGRGPGDAGL